jgi:general L-amino acid transport system permease protein
MIAPAPPRPQSPPPETVRLSPWVWLRRNLFNSWLNALITLLLVGLLWQLGSSFLVWAFTKAQWVVISDNWTLFFVGRFPPSQRWRLWLMLGLVVGLAGLAWGIVTRGQTKIWRRGSLTLLAGVVLVMILLPTDLTNRLSLLVMLGVCLAARIGGRRWGQRRPSLGTWLPAFWTGAFFLGLWLLMGGFGLESISSGDWGGFLLTVLMSLFSILLCFPLGLLLALGRQSNLVLLRLVSVAYIEFMRGAPLITILFLGQVMIPLFLPPGMRPDRILRAILGLTLFTAAYIAENVRGGLQAIPKGQFEAAASVGLNPVLTYSFIVLPQALKIAVPTIIGQFISLFQDTTLLSIVGLIELLGISRAVLTNPAYIGRYAEVYLFIGVIYWTCCTAMSLGSRYLERSLNTEHR